MAGDIPRYSSHLDYYRPSRRAPAADMWSQINRGVQGALGGFMKYQQEKEYNNFQEGTGAFYSSINKDMSQEEIAKKAMEIKKTYKFNKDYASKFDLAIGRVDRYNWIETQKQGTFIDAHCHNNNVEHEDKLIPFLELYNKFHEL